MRWPLNTGRALNAYAHDLAAREASSIVAQTLGLMTLMGMRPTPTDQTREVAIAAFVIALRTLQDTILLGGSIPQPNSVKG